MKKARMKTISATIDQGLLEKIDELINKYRKVSGNIGYSRSDFIREALYHYYKVMKEKLEGKQ